MNDELESVAQSLKKAATPEDVFGSFSGTRKEQLFQARSVYRRMIRVVFPDKYPLKGEKALAEEATKKLNRFYEIAQEKINNGNYGEGGSFTKTTSTVIKSPKFEYEMGELLEKVDSFALYKCTWTEKNIQQIGILKVPSSSAENDLIENEAKVLKLFDGKDEMPGMRAYVSKLTDTFAYKNSSISPNLSVNVFSNDENLYSLKQVLAKYPKGIDPKQVAWMWGRLLIALGYTHQHGVLHGAVLPDRILIQPKEHGLVLTDFTYAVESPAKTGKRITAISSEYETWYPPEVFRKELPTPSMDIYMGARCMIALLGGDPVEATFPADVPVELQGFFTGCLMDAEKMRPNDAFILRDEFIQLIERLWGRRKFIPFSM